MQGKIKSKKLGLLVRAVNEKIAEDEKLEKPKYSNLKELVYGKNSDKKFVGRVICSLEKEDDVPMCFLVVDGKYNFAVISIYNTNRSIQDVVKFNSEVVVSSPNVVKISLEDRQKTYSFNCIKIMDLNSILIDGEALINKFSKTILIYKTFV